LIGCGVGMCFRRVTEVCRNIGKYEALSRGGFTGL
jgi:hypothetical protein